MGGDDLCPRSVNRHPLVFASSITASLGILTPPFCPGISIKKAPADLLHTTETVRGRLTAMGNTDCSSCVFLIHLQTPCGLLLVVERTGDSGRDKRDRQPFLLPILCSGSRGPVSPLTQGNKKAQSHHTHVCPEQWPTAPSVDSIQFVYEYQYPSVVDIDFVLSRTLDLVC